MGLKNFVDFIMGNKKLGKQTTNLSVRYEELLVETYYIKFSIDSCISIIANALASAEFQTYRTHKKVKNDNYYMFNIQPNLNQNAYEFWHELVSNLVYKNEALVIQHGEQLLIAEEFTHEKKALVEDKYTNVVVRDFTFNKPFNENDVFYFKLNNNNLAEIIETMYQNYGKLIESATKNYKRANGMKGFIEIDTTVAQTENMQENLKKLMEQKFGDWFKADDAVLPLSKGFKFTDATPQNSKGDTRDIRALIDDTIDFSCAALHVPSGLVKGDTVGVTEQVDSFLAFCINPLAKLIETETNRKYYKKQGFIKGNFLKVDTLRIKNIDLQKMASAGDLLFRIGVNSINDNLEMLGREKISDAWADEHYVTKNYQSVLSINQEALKGGENDGKKNSES